MITLNEAFHASDYETWLTYWSRCKVNTIFHKYPDYTAEDNPVLVRFREIPDGEDVEIPHPDIEVKQIETHLDTYCFKTLLKALPENHRNKTLEGIQLQSANFHDAMAKREKDFDEFLEYKLAGNLNIETIDNTKPISWESIRTASTEELFQTKLEIFETQPVQESDKKEYRSNIRKASSIIEAMHWYYLIVNDIEMSTSEKSEEKIPENIDILLADISSETLFKYKLQLFEKEEIQNSENKKARSKLRKATNLIELFSAYNEVILLDKKE
jgi:hypothetical protein